MKKNKCLNKKTHLFSVVISYILLLLTCVIFVVAKWYKTTFNITFGELYYTLISPLKGTGVGTIKQIIEGCITPVLLLWLMVTAAYFLLLQHRVDVTFSFKSKVFHLKEHGRYLIVSVILFCISICYLCSEVKLIPYLKSAMDSTSIYEDYYVNPDDVTITSNGQTKNIIHLYLESMETTYASESDGGFQGDNNYIPNLTELAKENISFSNSDKLGGFNSPNGTRWTSSALFSSTTGIPYAFPVDSNQQMTKHARFAGGTTALGDILNKYNYKQEFLCGSDATFGARKKFFEEHGNFDVFDYQTAIEKKYIASDYFVWWGFEDSKLYSIAKDEISHLSESDEPFNFTFLTVDTHHVGGYVCNECENKYDIPLANVLNCADRQVYEFVNWCKQQSFYDNTVIVITGDHPRMDDVLVSGIDTSDRTVYNCIINSETQIQSDTHNRVLTTLDMFPTVLASMGFEIEGNQLGLGVNLFSNKKTLAEEFGYDYLDTELGKYSKYYIDHFS